MKPKKKPVSKKATPKKNEKTIYLTRDGSYWYAWETKKDAVLGHNDPDHDEGVIGGGDEVCETWARDIGLDAFPNHIRFVEATVKLSVMNLQTCKSCGSKHL